VNCEQAEPLLGAYVLDALPEEEAAELRAHLRTCADHASKAAELRAVAVRLPALAEARTPPAGLRSRVLDAVAREPQDGRPVSLDAARLRDDSRRDARQPRLRRPPVYAWAALAAAVVAGFVALLVWNIVLLNGGGSDAQHLASRVTSVSQLQPTGTLPGGGTVLYFADEHKAVIIANDLPGLSSSQAYQLWAVPADGRPKSLGLVHPDASGHTQAVVAYDVADGNTIAMTVEPAGGSDQPTSDPIYAAKV
jgi:anti-sigma-K factor RskA